jgi:hypothetical protein
MASAAVAGALNAAFGAAAAPAPFDAAEVVAAMTAAIAAEYQRLGIAGLAAGDRNSRFNATLALARVEPPLLHLLLVGDSGARINGATVYQDSKLLDRITADLRAEAHRLLAARVGDAAERDALAGQLAFHGTRHPPAALLAALPEGALGGIEAGLAAWYARHHPAVPAEAVMTMIAGGILSGQSLHQNNAASPLGYSCLDGFPVPMALVRHVPLKLAEVASVELFSDGYFACADGLGVAAWEAMFERIEREDPLKLTRYRSVKGSGADGRKADDRSYLCVRGGWG